MKNVGKYDRIVRFILGAFLFSLVFVGPQTLWGLVGVVLMATSLFSFCPIYRVLGMSTDSTGS